MDIISNPLDNSGQDGILRFITINEATGQYRVMATGQRKWQHVLM